MKRSVKSLKGFTMGATDDETWTIRNLIVNTGGWLRDQSLYVITVEERHKLSKVSPYRYGLTLTFTKCLFENWDGR